MIRFFENLFKPEERCGESVVLIDVGVKSIGGAYAYYQAGQMPALLYTRRLPIEPHAGESPEAAMLRALRILGNDLIREGAPILARVAGSGSADSILVSIGAPWEETSVRTEHFNADKPFTFTKNLVEEKLAEANAESSTEKLIVDSIIGTVLNGYATRNPYGREVHRASIVVLTSLIDAQAANSITSTLQSLYHTKRILPIAHNSLLYQAMRIVFPHEREALVVSAIGPVISVSLIRRGILVATVVIPGTTKDGSWATDVVAACAAFAQNYPLPCTLFLLAREADMATLRQELTAAPLNTLWLSSNPPRIMPVAASSLIGLVHCATTTPPDLSLLFMAAYRQHHTGEVE